jgi:hypothetical protein
VLSQAEVLRLIEAPKTELKRVQRLLLDRLLAQLPTHEAAHGFVRGRGVHTHALVHAAQPCVICFDLRDFFPSIGAARIRAFWRRWGYPEDVAKGVESIVAGHFPFSTGDVIYIDGGFNISRL